MNIDITDNEADEIIDVLETYPNGHLEVQGDRVYWIAKKVRPKPQKVDYSQYDNPRGPPKQVAKKTFDFDRALDTLGSVMGPPAR